MRIKWPIGALSSLVCILMWQATPRTAQADGQGRSVWDGAYASAQAERGKSRFTSLCRRCHNDDLNGSERGPALRGERFLTNWEAQDLGRLFAKIKGTMPPDSPASLADDEYVDVLGYILQVNGFPSGQDAVAASTLDSIVMARKPDGGPRDVPNFRLVRVVGCLTRGPDKAWVLANTTDPVPTTDQPSTAAVLKEASVQSLGSGAFRLIGASTFNPEGHEGEKMQAKGLVYRAPNKDRINVISLEGLGSHCGNQLSAR
jgi:hypothetical protein